VMLMLALHLLLRYARWTILLRKGGIQYPFFKGLLCYFSGFAFTATPGKVGELSRLWFYGRDGISAYHIISSFVIERLFDLVIVLVLASSLLFTQDYMLVIGLTVQTIILSIIVVIYKPNLIRPIRTFGLRFNIKSLVRLVCLFKVVSQIVRKSVDWFTGLGCLLLGTLAWLTICSIFVLFCGLFAAPLPLADLLPIYPAAMLVGAISFIPGGVGTTEAAMIALLTQYDVTAGVAMLIAVQVRFFTLWLTMLIGLISVVWLNILKDEKVCIIAVST
jgi:uncharacterized protein (TIRG00374 family)